MSKIKEAIAKEIEMSQMSEKFNDLIEELKSMFTVSQAMARNSFDSTQPIKDEPDNPDPEPSHKYPEQPPKCKTCGDTKQTPTPQSVGFGIQNAIMQECPDCTEQPLAGDFTAKIRKRWLAEALHQDSTLDYAICAIIDLCIRLDRSEASRKALLAALKRYGECEAGCILGNACNCGLKAAINSNKEISGEKERKL